MSDFQNEENTTEMPSAEKHDPLNDFLRHQQRAFEETGKALESLLPPDFRDHSREAGREFGKGMKVLFDAALDGLEQVSKEVDKNLNRNRPASSSDDDRPSGTGTTKVKVQVD